MNEQNILIVLWAFFKWGNYSERHNSFLSKKNLLVNVMTFPVILVFCLNATLDFICTL